MGRHDEERRGRVTQTLGRRVLVEADGEEVVCFLSGQRAVVGDCVHFVDVDGGGGKLVRMEDRRSELVRVGHNHREQVLAANLEGILVVVAPAEPPFKAGLVDRYAVAAAVSGLEMALVINKDDQPRPDGMDAELEVRKAHGLEVLSTSARDGTGLEGLAAHIATHDAGPWALVGHSGVGKTSLVAALLPELDVGAVGELSEYWGTGQHTTTHTRLFRLPTGGELVDSPGIRTFTPGGLTVDNVRLHFPGMPYNVCKYRDCQHRAGEEGCSVPDVVDAELLTSYRRLLEDVRSQPRR